MSVEGWLQGLAALGCTFVRLVKDGKRPLRTLDHYAEMTGARGVNAALQWLGKGSPVGVMPKPPLWILDADSTSQVERVVSVLSDQGINPLMVLTPSGGAHFYGILPDDFTLEGLKNHLGTEKMDYKFGPRTLVVCPGSRRKGRPYEPVTAWVRPPTMDPRWFRDGGFWHVRDDRPFLANQRPLKDRLAAARRYLELRAPVSVSGDHGRRTLAAVCIHVVAFHRIPPRTALDMLASWNARCVDKATGALCPWSRTELMDALDAAVGSTPEAGVKALQRAKATSARREVIAAHAELVKASLRPGAPKVPVWRVRRLLRWFGLDLTETAFGRALGAAGVARVPFGRSKVQAIPAMDYAGLVTGLLRAKRTPLGGTLKKHKPSPHASTGIMERVVSELNRQQTSAIPGFCRISNRPETAA